MEIRDLIRSLYYEGTWYVQVPLGDGLFTVRVYKESLRHELRKFVGESLPVRRAGNKQFIIVLGEREK